jgi:hypothetical protein
MTILNEDGAMSLVMEIFPHIERYSKQHGDASTVVDGLWALALLTSYLLCSRGLDTEVAKRGFIHALDHAIAIAPPDHERFDAACTPTSSECHGTKH